MPSPLSPCRPGHRPHRRPAAAIPVDCRHVIWPSGRWPTVDLARQPGSRVGTQPRAMGCKGHDPAAAGLIIGRMLRGRTVRPGLRDRGTGGQSPRQTAPSSTRPSPMATPPLDHCGAGLAGPAASSGYCWWQLPSPAQGSGPGSEKGDPGAGHQQRGQGVDHDSRRDAGSHNGGHHGHGHNDDGHGLGQADTARTVVVGRQRRRGHAVAATTTGDPGPDGRGQRRLWPAWPAGAGGHAGRQVVVRALVPGRWPHGLPARAPGQGVVPDGGRWAAQHAEQRS